MYLISANEKPEVIEGSLNSHSLPAPNALDDLGLSETFLAQLTLKHCFYLDIFTIKDLAERLKLNFTITQDLVANLVHDRCVEVRGADPYQHTGAMLGLSNRYTLTEEGKRRAFQLIEYDGYVGPAPVTLESYWNQVTAQSIQSTEHNMEDLQRAFDGLVIPEDILEQLGPALMSGKSLFLYGPSGNGKTSIAFRLGEIWQDAVLIPYALYIDGHVIRIFDEINHRPVGNTAVESESGDHRWVLCHRPCLVVGGELTLGMLDLAYNPTLRYYGAPLQLKANNGIFVIDDFGRQQISPQVILNRWILPLENRKDFLCLSTGQQFGIPFDQLLVFATNLEPEELLDPAFLRRIRAKVKVRDTDTLQFKEIFHLTCQQYQFDYVEETIEYLLDKYYNGNGNKRPMAACHPRDLIEQILDYCRFNKLTPLLTKENLDRACQVYFI
jgi:hypothetical protein